MGLFDKIKTQANTIGTNISESTSKLTSDISTASKENQSFQRLILKLLQLTGN